MRKHRTNVSGSGSGHRILCWSLGAALGVTGLVGLPGCEQEEAGPAEEAGEQIDEAAEEAGRKAEEAAEEAGKKAEETGEKARDAAEDATEN